MIAVLVKCDLTFEVMFSATLLEHKTVQHLIYKPFLLPLNCSSLIDIDQKREGLRKQSGGGSLTNLLQAIDKEIERPGQYDVVL